MRLQAPRGVGSLPVKKIRSTNNSKNDSRQPTKRTEGKSQPVKQTGGKSQPVKRNEGKSQPGKRSEGRAQPLKRTERKPPPSKQSGGKPPPPAAKTKDEGKKETLPSGMGDEPLPEPTEQKVFIGFPTPRRRWRRKVKRYHYMDEVTRGSFNDPCVSCYSSLVERHVVFANRNLYTRKCCQQHKMLL